MKCGICLFLCSIGLSITAAGGMPDRDLILHYSFDHTEGRIIPDLSGCGNHGTNNGAAWVSRGVLGPAMQFDGGQHIVFGTFPQVNGAKALSFGGWIRPVGRGILGVMGKTGHMNETFGLVVNESLLQIDADVRRADCMLTLYVNGSLSMDAWQHVMYVYDGRVLSVYKDGVLLGRKEAAFTAPVAGNDIQATVGDYCLNRRWFFKGALDDLRVYRRALGAAEVHALANPAGLDPSVRLARNLPARTIRTQNTKEEQNTPSGALKPTADTVHVRAPGMVAPVPTYGVDTPALMRVTMSNRADGDGDVTEYLPDESAHIAIQDVDLPATSGAVTMRVEFAQSASGVADQAVMTALTRQPDGRFTGAQPLAVFRPGRLRVTVMGEIKGDIVLFRRSTIRIHASSDAMRQEVAEPR